MTTPIDGVEGTQGKLFYWTRQGISLADFQKKVEEALALIQAAGGVVGITQLGIDLVTSTTQLEARQVIDAAQTGSGGGGGGAINLPIEMTDVNGLPAALTARSLVGHLHVTNDIQGVSGPVRAIFDSTNHATLVTAIGMVVADLGGITDVGISALTAAGANLAARQAAFRAAIAAADIGLVTRVDALEAGSGATELAATPWLLGTTAGVYPPRPATSRAVWFTDKAVQPTNNGLITGGGGMVPDGTLPNGLVDFWVS